MSPNRHKIDAGMVLAAGLGTRMRPLTDTRPKALVEVAGRALVDYALDRFDDAGLSRLVVNVHHHADMLESHVAARSNIIVSDERAKLLETGGGVKQALGLLGDGPFFVANCDSLLLNGVQPYLDRMATAWDPSNMDALLLCVRAPQAHGYEGMGDFTIDAVGIPARRTPPHLAPYVFTGVQILHAGLFKDTPDDAPFSLNLIYNRLLETDRLRALVHDGAYYHVGTPDAVATTEALMAEPPLGVSDQ